MAAAICKFTALKPLDSIDRDTLFGINNNVIDECACKSKAISFVSNNFSLFRSLFLVLQMESFEHFSSQIKRNIHKFVHVSWVFDCLTPNQLKNQMI